VGGRGQKNLKILLQICDNPERSQKFSSKMAFFSQKSKKNIGGGRVAFNENFIGGGGDTLSPPHPPKLMYG
jgi:hypothetical protein